MSTKKKPSLVKPKRRLASNTLKQALRAFIVPVVADRYNVFTVRVLWKVEKNHIYKANEQVNAKQRQLELLLEQNDEIILFISCITGQEKGALTKRKRKQEQDSDDDGKSDDSNDNDADLIPSTLDTANKAIYPGRTFWIVMEAPQACVNDVQTNLMKIMLQSGLEIDSCKPIIPRGKKDKVEVYTAALCQAIKDYNTKYVTDVAKDSAEGFASVSAMYLHGVLNEEHIAFGPEFGKKPVRIAITKNCPEAVCEEFMKALDDISFTNFTYDLVIHANGKSVNESPTGSEIPRGPVSGSKICSDIYMLDNLMRKLDYVLYKGQIFKKAKEARYTYVRCCPVEQFVHAVLSNKRMADLLAPQVNQIASILSNKGCHIIKQLTIDRNLIEVKPFGTCFNINRKMFVESPLPDDQVGNVTPRAYVSYTYEKDKVPYPKKFVKTIENSFEDPDQMLHFVKKYYQLL